MNQCGFDHERFDAAMKELAITVAAAQEQLVNAHRLIAESAQQLGEALILWLKTPGGQRFQKLLARERTR